MMKRNGVFVRKPNRRIKGQRRTERQDRRRQSMQVTNCRRAVQQDRRIPTDDRRLVMGQADWVQLTITDPADVTKARFYGKGKESTGRFVNIAV